ncbi:reverse transcriptase domain-containing protein [Tanacetum coccineum]
MSFRVATLRAVVLAGDKTCEDARSWYMISGDAKSWNGNQSQGGTSGQAGRCGGRTGSRCGDQGSGRNDGQGGQVGGQGSGVNDGVDGVPRLLHHHCTTIAKFTPHIVAQVGDQGRGQGNGRNQNGDAINDNIPGDVRNVIENKDRRGCTYKELLACNPKEYDEKGGAVIRTLGLEAAVGMSWDNFKVLMRKEFCPSNEMHKLELIYEITPWSGLAMLRILIGSMSWLGMVAAMKPSTIQKAVQIAGTLTDEALRNGSIKKNPDKRGNRGEPSKDRNERDGNKRTRIGNAFAITANPVRREYTGHFSKDCRVVPRNVESGSKAKGNHQNQVVAVNRGQGRGNNGNRACGRAFMLGAEEARQDPNILTGTFTLNNHYAITLFDSGADYSFVSTTCIPLLGIEPNDLGFSYEIKIASGQLVEIDKVINGCKLEIEGHVFDINLIPFGSGSFDMIIGMDWLSNHKAEIICHEKVVRIPLPDGKILRVIGERPEEKMRHLRSNKTKEQKQEEIVVVRDYPKVFPDDLSGLPPNREIEFRIELVPGAIPDMKSPYRLEASEDDYGVLDKLSLDSRFKAMKVKQLDKGVGLEAWKKESIWNIMIIDFWIELVP